MKAKRILGYAGLFLLQCVNVALLIWILSFDTLNTARVLDYPP